MNSIRCLVICLSLSPVATVLAQPVSRNFDAAYTDSLTLLRVEEIQKELGIDPNQNAKLKAALAPLRARYEKQVAGLSDLSSPENHKKYLQLREVIKQEGSRIAAQQLKPEQFKRYQQICLQQKKLEAFLTPEIRQSLKLSAEQTEQIEAILKERDKKIRGLKKFSAEGLAKIQQEALKDILSKLSAQQNNQWRQMVGQPFDFDIFGMLKRLK